MPANALRGLRPFTRTGSCVLRPECRYWLAVHGLVAAHDFLALPGVVVSGHVGRNVSRVQIGGRTAYLKREHRVRWRDRFRSWRDGFGWASVSAREAAVLRHLDEHRLPGPRWLAYGEADGEAFLLLEAAERAIDLRAIDRLSDALADRLGNTVARLHAAGVDQPDLFAKHILVRPDTNKLTILDWQRATLRDQVSRRQRVRGLAALRTTWGDAAGPAWDRLLAAYAKVANLPTTLLRRAVESRADALARRPGIRRQLTPAPAQDLVRIGGETVCAIPRIARLVDHPDSITALYDPTHDGRDLFGGRLHVSRYRLPFARWWAAVRGRAWRSPELKTARLLFHLERHRIPAPKLLAYGQMAPALRPAVSFVLWEPIPSRPPTPADRDVLKALLARLHEAGCCLRQIGPAGEPFGMVGSGAVVTDVRCLHLARRLTARQQRRDFARLEAFFRGRP